MMNDTIIIILFLLYIAFMFYLYFVGVTLIGWWIFGYRDLFDGITFHIFVRKGK